MSAYTDYDREIASIFHISLEEAPILCQLRQERDEALTRLARMHVSREIWKRRWIVTFGLLMGFIAVQVICKVDSILEGF